MDTLEHTSPRFADALRSLTLTASPETRPSPGRPVWRWTLLAAALASAALTALAAGNSLSWREAPPTAPEAMAGLPVAMAMPAPGPVRQEITGSGYVVAPNETTVFSRTEGRIIAVPVQTGDRVAAGQVLITLADAAAGFGLEQAQAGRTAAELALAAREIELKQAEAALARQTALAASQAVARAQVDEARSRRDLAANAVLMARQAVDEAALAVRIAAERVADLTIRAPIAGTVTRLNAHVGDTVLARAEGVRAGDSLATITDTTRMVIDADVAETGIAGLRPGLRGEATLDGYPDQPFKVEILRIAPVISAEKGTVSLRMSLTGPPAGIRPAMAARLRIFTGTEGAGE